MDIYQRLPFRWPSPLSHSTTSEHSRGRTRSDGDYDELLGMSCLCCIFSVVLSVTWCLAVDHKERSYFDGEHAASPFPWGLSFYSDVSAAFVLARSTSIEFSMSLRDRDVKLTAAFDSYYCNARGFAVCSRERGTDKLATIFRGSDAVQEDWFAKAKRDSEALKTALRTCQRLLVANNGRFSESSQPFLKARVQSN